MPILIVDDEKDIRETLEEFFADEGFEVRTAADGAEALDLLADSELPCVVIIDLMMPVLSGNDVIDQMQQSQRLAPVPIIVTTSDPSRAPPGIPVMKKPMNLQGLLSAVEQHCKRRREPMH